MKKQAVIIGAGNIGRGFIGQILHDSFYSVQFVDVDTLLVNRLNLDKAYPLTLIDEQECQTLCIDNVSAIHGQDCKQVAEALAAADIAAVSVGQNALRFVAQNLALGIKKRSACSGKPFNILICENIRNAKEYVYQLLLPHFSYEERYILDAVGLVETTIGRMVPSPTEAMRRENPAAIIAEPYCSLPLDIKAFMGPMPALRYTETLHPFTFYEEKKLFIHNLGHALCAYVGAIYGHEYIWQVVNDPQAIAVPRAAMLLMASSIASAYGVAEEELHEFVDDLIVRFGNRQLNDPIARVGKDPLRKLSASDRLMGGLKRCESQGNDPAVLLQGIAAALRYDDQRDKETVQMQAEIKQKGVQGFVQEHCGLSKANGQRIESIYNGGQIHAFSRA